MILSNAMHQEKRSPAHCAVGIAINHEAKVQVEEKIIQAPRDRGWRASARGNFDISGSWPKRKEMQVSSVGLPTRTICVGQPAWSSS